MKKILSILLVLAMMLSMLALVACDKGGNQGNQGNQGNNGNQGNTATGKPAGMASFDVPEVGYDGSAVTVVFYHSMGAKLQGVLNTYIPEFNKLYPNITIEHSSMGDYDGVRDQIKTQLTAGEQPNIAYCYPDHVALYNVAKKVIPLDNLIASTIEVTDAEGNKTILGLTDEQKADFIEGYYKEGAAFDTLGTMYTLPMSKSTEALYYNKTFFAENGLKVPTTWEEMEQVCAAIKAIDPDCVPLGYDSEANWFITMCEQYKSPYTSLEEGNHFLFDNETNRGFVKMFREWHQKGYVTTEAIYGSYTSGLFTATEGQRCYMVIGSTGGASYQTPPTVDGNPLFETGMATPPQVDPNAPKVISQGPSLCLFDSENPQEVIASWLFMKFLTTNVNFQAEFSMKSGYAPVIKSVQENAVYQGWLDKASGFNNLTALSVKLALSQSDAYFVSPAFNGSSVARDQVGILMQDALVSTDSNVDAVLKRLFEKAIDECEYAVD